MVPEAIQNRQNEITNGCADCNPILDATEAEAQRAEKMRPVIQNETDVLAALCMNLLYKQKL